MLCMAVMALTATSSQVFMRAISYSVNRRLFSSHPVFWHFTCKLALHLLVDVDDTHCCSTDSEVFRLVKPHADTALNESVVSLQSILGSLGMTRKSRIRFASPKPSFKALMVCAGENKTVGLLGLY
jgi:hypothetical protein